MKFSSPRLSLFFLIISWLGLMAIERYGEWLIIPAIATLFLGIGGLRHSPNRMWLYAICLSLVATAIFAPALSPFDPVSMRIQGQHHLIGLDVLGRDRFSLLLYAHRFSFFHAFPASILATLLGLFYGIILTFFPKKMKRLSHSLLQVFLAFPILLTFLICLTLFETPLENHPFVGLVILTVCCLWGEPAKIFHTAMEDLKEKEFVQASRLAGFSTFSILKRDILPNLKLTFLINSLLVFINAVILESIMGFLGLVSDSTTPNLGKMVYSGLQAPSQEGISFLLALIDLLLWITTMYLIVGSIQKLSSDGDKLHYVSSTNGPGTAEPGPLPISNVQDRVI